MAVDVIENPSVDVATFDENITVFNDVTQRLGVLDNRYSYILFLWMKNLKIYTFERQPEGGEYKLGVVGQLGAQAMSQAINEMEIEVPTIIYAFTLNNTFGETIDCNDFYSN